MTDDPLLTLRQVADELGLPESTVRYYRDAFLDHIPSVGTGRRRRYPPPAVAVLRSIAEGYASGRSRDAIFGTLAGATPRPTPGIEEQAAADHGQPGAVSNLELLAAIVDGEREQRDALWQMAKEIVRLTEVLEGQEKVLTEIADHAGVRPALGAAQPAPRALAEGTASAIREPPPARMPPPPPIQAAPPPPPATVVETPAAWTAPAAAPPVLRVEAPSPPPPPPPPPPAPAVFVAPPPPREVRVDAPPAGGPVGSPAMPPRASESAASAASPTEMERLRVELESERQLVERLREAKVKLEHRVSDAEAALEEHRPRKRSSVLGRFLKPGEDA